MTKYKFSITLQKVGISLVEILVAGALVYFTGHPGFLVLVPIAEGIRNWLKNK